MAGQTVTVISVEVLAAALAGLELQRERIDGHIAQIREMLGRRGPGRPRKEPKVGLVSQGQPTGRPDRRRFSAQARARMAEAQRKRWAATKRNVQAQGAPVNTKRHLSAEARGKMAAAARKRWAAARKAKKTAP